MKCWSSVGSDVVFRTCPTNQLDQNKKQIQESVSGTRLNSHYHKNFKFISLVRRIWRSTLVPETISRRCIQTFRTCWTTRFHLGELNWSRRQLFMTLTVLVWFVSWKLRRLAKATGHLRTKPDVFETTYFFFYKNRPSSHTKKVESGSRNRFVLKPLSRVVYTPSTRIWKIHMRFWKFPDSCELGLVQ